MPFTLLDNQPSPFADASEWRKYLSSLEQRGDPEQDPGLMCAIKEARQMIAMKAQESAGRT